MCLRHSLHACEPRSTTRSRGFSGVGVPCFDTAGEAPAATRRASMMGCRWVGLGEAKNVPDGRRPVLWMLQLRCTEEERRTNDGMGWDVVCDGGRVKRSLRAADALSSGGAEGEKDGWQKDTDVSSSEMPWLPGLPVRDVGHSNLPAMCHPHLSSLIRSDDEHQSRGRAADAGCLCPSCVRGC